MYENNIKTLCQYITDHYNEIRTSSSGCHISGFVLEDYKISELPQNSKIIVSIYNISNLQVMLIDSSMKICFKICTKINDYIFIYSIDNLLKNYYMGVDLLYFIDNFDHYYISRNYFKIGNIYINVIDGNYVIRKNYDLYYLKSLNEICEKFPEIYKYQKIKFQKLAIELDIE